MVWDNVEAIRMDAPGAAPKFDALMGHAVTARITLLRGHTLLDITHSQLEFGQKDPPLDQKDATIFTSEMPKGSRKREGRIMMHEA